MSFLLMNANETSIARGYFEYSTRSITRLLASYMVIVMYPIINYFIYGNYNVPYYNAADQCIRLSPKMASFAMCFSFYDQKTPSWNSELKEINEGNTRPRKKADIGG